MRVPLCVALAALLLAGCDTSEPETAEVQSGEARLALGETVVLDGLAITFDAVRSDSRCPPSVVCIWAGEASVALTIQGERFVLGVSHTGVRVGSLEVRAVGLTPYAGEQGSDGETPVVEVETVEVGS